MLEHVSEYTYYPQTELSKLTVIQSPRQLYEMLHASKRLCRCAKSHTNRS